MISDAALRRVLSDAAVRLWGDVIRALSLTAVLAICAAWLAYYWFSVKTVLLPLNMNDFGKFYYSARLFLDGGNMYGPSAATLIPITETTSRHFWNMNPPHFHVLLLPLAMLGPAPALLVWTAGNLVCLGVSIFLVVRTLHLRAHVFGILWSTLAALSFAATGAIVITGQLTFLLLLPFTVAWVAARQGNWTKAGGYLGLCIAAKPVLLPFLGYLLVKRRWASAGVACAVMAASFMTGIAVFGWQAHKDWLSVLSSVDWPWATMNGSVLGFVTRNLAPGGLYASAAVLPWAIQPLWLSASLAIGLATMWSAMADRSPEATDRGLLLVALATQLVSPLGWVYYLWLPLGPAAALLVQHARHGTHGSTQPVSPSSVRWRRGFLIASVPFLVCPLALTLGFQPRPWVTLTLGSAYFWGTLFLWICALIDWRMSNQRFQYAPLPLATAASVRLRM